MNPATITIGNAAKIKKFAPNVAAAMFQSTMKFKSADMFHNIIAKQNAAKFQSIMMSNIANHAKNGYAIKNAAMFQDTITSMYANQHAKLSANKL